MDSPEFREAMTASSPTSPATSTDDCPGDPMLPFINQMKPNWHYRTSISTSTTNTIYPVKASTSTINVEYSYKASASTMNINYRDKASTSTMNLDYPQDILRQAMESVQRAQAATFSPTEAHPRDFNFEGMNLNGMNAEEFDEDATSQITQDRSKNATPQPMELVHCPDGASFTHDKEPPATFTVGGMESDEFRTAAKAAVDESKLRSPLLRRLIR